VLCAPKRAEPIATRGPLAGIVILIAGSNFVGIYNAFICKPIWILLYNVPLAVMLGLAVFYTNAPSYSGTQYDEYRVLTLAASVAIGGLPMAHWLFVECAGKDCQWHAAWPTAVLGLCYGLGFIVFYFRIPECFAPGKFDLWLHSHQWWHLLVFSAACVWLHGMLAYFNWRHGVNGTGSVEKTLLGYGHCEA
jgi:adiponectin receptor